MSHNPCNCDNCQGVRWPAPQPITDEKRKEAERIARDIGENARKHVEQQALYFLLGEPEGFEWMKPKEP